MKRLLFFFCSLLAAVSAHSQAIDSVMLSQLKLNFVVPDLPAFKALGTEPSNLLRPSTPDAFAVSLSEFYEDRKIVIPKALAVEISPSLLLNAKKGPQELQHYADNRILNSFRVSMGTSSDTVLSPLGRSLALGFRINLINEGEFITDKGELDKISQKLAEFRSTERGSRRQFATTYLADIKALAGDKDSTHTRLDQVIDWEFFLDKAIKSTTGKDTLIRNRYERFRSGYAGSGLFDQWLAAEKESYKKDNWNATKLDLGLAIVGSSADSLVGNMKFNRSALWLTLALRAGKNGQLLIGMNAQAFQDLRDTATTSKGHTFLDFSLPVRYLIGTNRVKGFTEAQYRINTNLASQSLLLNLGAEINPIDGVWVNLYGGLDYSPNTGNASFNGSFKLKLTLPENFKLF